MVRFDSRPDTKNYQERNGCKMVILNLAAMRRLHLMTYINLAGFLKSPEKALIKMFAKSKQNNHNQLLLIT